jgi:protocatechuate 3,4-dioxygenase beta subunit
VTPFVLLALFAAAPQQVAPPPPPPPPVVQPPRDPGLRGERKGTGIIRGRVVAADTGLPIRQANVNLMSTQDGTGGPTAGGPTTTRRSTRTDDQGSFEFKELPAGAYRVFASTGQYSVQYLNLGYGAKRSSGDPGVPIKLTSGQTFDKATIALPRGAVIAGRVIDDGGEPLARVQVYGLWFAPGSTRGERNSGGVQTDDLGQFRLYGLEAGEYAVVAEARMGTFVAPNTAFSESEEDRSGFLTTYYPGTPDESSAQRVRTRAGSEMPGIEIRMTKGRLYRISGVVLDSQGNPIARANGQLGRRTTSSGMMNNGFTTDDQGRFQMQNLSPGNYRVNVRQRQQRLGPSGPEGDPGEMASVPLTIGAADVENLTIVTAPGVTLTGHVEFEQGPPSQPVTQMRVTAIPGEPDQPMFGPPPGASVQRDLTFLIRGLSGEYLIRGGGGLPQNHYVKAVLVGGQDISDTPREFTAQDHVTLLVSSRGATLGGTVTDAKGTPALDAGVLVFPDDKAGWRANSTRVRRGSPDANGQYRISPLHPGRYFIIAAPRERLNTFPGTDYLTFYDELSKDATALVINEDETRTVDLKVVASGGQ